MEKYYKMVIELYKEAITLNRVNPDRLQEVNVALANAITTARVLNAPTSELEALQGDIKPLMV